VAIMKAHYKELRKMLLRFDTQSLESLQISVVPTLCEPCSARTLRSLVHVAPTSCSQARTLWWLSWRSMTIQILRIVRPFAHVSSQEA
jgi:hypothetical protein